MIENVYVLQDIYKFSEIGYYMTNKILNNIKESKDNIKQILYQEKKTYKKYKEEVSNLLEMYDSEIEKMNFINKFKIGLEINMKVSFDDLKEIPNILLTNINDNLIKMKCFLKEINNLDNVIKDLLTNFQTFLLSEKKLLTNFYK